MHLPNRTPIAAAVIALCAGFSSSAQAQSVTIEAESMSLSSYVVENGTRIKVKDGASVGTATKSFSGSAGTYDMVVTVLAETDGQPTLEVYKGTTLLKKYTYPLANAMASFTIPSVPLAAGETIRLVGRTQGGAWARVDKVVLNSVATSTSSTTSSTTITSITSTSTATPTAVTMEAESMSLSSFVVENGTRIRVKDGATSGTATRAFGGATGTYNMQVTVLAENVGQPKLAVYRGATLLKEFTYPLANATTTFSISSVPISQGEVIKLVGQKQGGAWARVDKIVFSPVTTTSTSTTTNTNTNTSTSTSTSTSACANPSGGYEGFGRNTTGGAGKPIYRVTNLNDSGSGSLRDALSQGNRCVVFDVGGTITLSSNLLMKGSNVTIDGLTALSPGITLKGATLVMQGTSGAGNIVLRGIRHRGAPVDADGIRVYNASNIVIDRVSVSGYGDGAIDVTEKSRDVTIQWSIIGTGNTSLNKATLIKYATSRVTIHHNLYINSEGRHPMCGNSDTATSVPAEIVCDVRNNLIWDFKRGTDIQDFGKANVVNNYYYSTRAYSTSDAIYNDGTASTYVSGNYSRNGWHINGTTSSTPFDAIVPTTTDAVTAAKQVVAQAGARGPRFGLDGTDQNHLGQISLD